MLASEEDVAIIFENALQIEVEGYEFYNKLTEKNFDEKTIQIFKFLRDEEQDHYQKIEELYEKKLPGYFQDYLEKDKESEKKGFIVPELINFFDKTEADVKKAFELGIEFEEKTISYFRNLTEEHILSDVKQVLDVLAQEEEKHIQILQNEQLKFK